jgi:hypothetical protein
MSFQKITSIIINKKRWTIGYGFPGKTKGKVDEGSCNYEKRKVIIHHKKKGRICSLAEIVFHEIAHARFPDMKEDSINELGKIAAAVFHKMQEYESDTL